MGYDYYAVEYELGNLKKVVQEGTPITFAQNDTLIHGVVTGVYNPFFMVKATYSNKFGSVTRQFSFSWTELAIWEVELRNRIKYQEIQSPDVAVVFISDELKERRLLAEDFMEMHMSAARSASSASSERAEKTKTKKKRTVKGKSKERIEAEALQKEEEKKASENGEKKGKFTRIYHDCAELVVESMKKGKVLLCATVDEDGFLRVSSYCICKNEYDPWHMPKGRDTARCLFEYSPVHCLDYNDHGECSCEVESKEEWRKRFNDPDTFISIYRESTELMDQIWIPHDSSDPWNTGKYNMEGFEDIVSDILDEGVCYLSSDQGNVYGPLECQFAKYFLEKNEDVCLSLNGKG